MSDLISRADAINAFWEDSDIRTAEVRATLKALPSADAVSRFHHDMEIKELKHQIKDRADAVQGEWIEREDWNGDYYYDCSVCGESFVLCDGTPSMNLYHYCPNCGAIMKGGAE